MKTAVLTLLLLTAAFASGFSAEFVGEKQITLCACDSTVIPIAIDNDGPATQVEFETRGSTGLAILSSTSFEMNGKSRTVKPLHVSAACNARNGFASIAAKAVDLAGNNAPEAGVIKVVQCSQIKLRPVSAVLSCGESEYEFEVENPGLENQKGTYSVNLVEGSYSLSPSEFNVNPGQKASVKVTVRKLNDADLGMPLRLMAKAETASAEAFAYLERGYCPTPTPTPNGDDGNGGNGNNGFGGFGALSGFFILALNRFSLEWFLLALAILLIGFFVYSISALEKREAEEDRKVLERGKKR